MSLADIILLVLVALSVVIGFWRGFIKEVFALAVWVLAFVLAFHYCGPLSARLTPWLELPSARTAAAFGGIFLLAIVVGGLLTWLIGKLVEKTGLSGSDRLLGGVFGALRGVLLIITLILLAGFTPIPQDPWWHESRVIAALAPLAEWSAEFLPENVREWLDLRGTGSMGASLRA